MSSRPDRDELIRAVGDEARAYQRSVDEFDELVVQLLGVNRTDGRCLDILSERGRMTAGELAQHANLTTGAVTGVLDRLERAGHVRRTRDEHDRRRVLVEVTPAFERWAGGVYGPLAARGQAALERFTTAELERFLEFMRLARAITDERADELRGELPAP